MIIGELRHGQLAIIDRIKETMRLSEGLDENPLAMADLDRENRLVAAAGFDLSFT
jgi:exopolyphosphatase/pppGpp-phosphohydrolase